MKPEWGLKRICQACGAKFYDMRRPEIICPKCGTPYVETAVKPKRARPEPKPEPVAKKKPVPAKAEDDLDLVAEEADLEVDDLEDDDEEEDAEKKEEDLIEDASDLGDDDDDVAEVLENVDGEKDH